MLIPVIVSDLPTPPANKKFEIPEFFSNAFKSLDLGSIGKGYRFGLGLLIIAWAVIALLKMPLIFGANIVPELDGVTILFFLKIQIGLAFLFFIRDFILELVDRVRGS